MLGVVVVARRRRRRRCSASSSSLVVVKVDLVKVVWVDVVVVGWEGVGLTCFNVAIVVAAAIMVSVVWVGVVVVGRNGAGVGHCRWLLSVVVDCVRETLFQVEGLGISCRYMLWSLKLFELGVLKVESWTSRLLTISGRRNNGAGARRGGLRAEFGVCAL